MSAKTATIYASCTEAIGDYLLCNADHAKGSSNETSTNADAGTVYAQAYSERPGDWRDLRAGNDLDRFHGVGHDAKVRRKRVGDILVVLPDLVHLRGGLDGNCRDAFGRGRGLSPSLQIMGGK